MTTYTIDVHNDITAFGSAKEAKGNPQAERFSSAKELGQLAENWPGSRLLEIWNSLPGQKTLKKFTSRKAAVRRIWRAIQSLAPNPAPQAPRFATKKHKWVKRARRARQRGTTQGAAKPTRLSSC